jgi:hypothetical protein
MPRQMPEQPHPLRTATDNANLAMNGGYLLVSGHAACVSVFIRRFFGVRAFRSAGIAALVVMYVYAVAAPCRAMRLFFPVWLGLLIVHRSVSLYRQWRGFECHSAYDGEPWAAMLLFRPRSEHLAKGVYEPLLAIAAGGYLFYTFSATLGLFVGSASISLFLKRAIERGVENAEIQAMKDKEYEMRARIARYRNSN